jgi:hypothetical protein
MSTANKPQQLDQPINIPATDVWTGESIGTLQQPFLLDEPNFLRLKTEPVKFKTASDMLIGAAIGYAITFGPKLIDFMSGKEANPVSFGEGVTAVAFLVAGIAVRLGSKWWAPTDASRTLAAIEEHFANAPKTHHPIKGKQ